MSPSYNALHPEMLQDSPCLLKWNSGLCYWCSREICSVQGSEKSKIKTASKRQLRWDACPNKPTSWLTSPLQANTEKATFSWPMPQRVFCWINFFKLLTVTLCFYLELPNSKVSGSTGSTKSAKSYTAAIKKLADCVSHLLSLHSVTSKLNLNVDAFYETLLVMFSKLLAGTFCQSICQYCCYCIRQSPSLSVTVLCSGLCSVTLGLLNIDLIFPHFNFQFNLNSHILF